jgi:hypothetical protein
MTPTTDLQKLLAEATKGPWMAIGTDPAEGIDCFWIKAQPNAFMRGFTKEIGSVNGSQNDPAQQANARLIAMAPDLAARVIELEAENARLREGLVLAKKSFEACVEWSNTTDFDFEIAAIAQALKGGEI